MKSYNGTTRNAPRVEKKEISFYLWMQANLEIMCVQLIVDEEYPLLHAHNMQQEGIWLSSIWFLTHKKKKKKKKGRIG